MRTFLIAADIAKGGTFSANNAVGLPVEIAILLFLAATLFWGIALLIMIRPETGRLNYRELAMTGLVAIGAYLWLDQLNGPAWAGRDQTTGLVMAQDCIKLSICHLTSVDSGVRGFTNGAMWLHFLTIIGLLHGTTVAVRAATIALISAGIAVIYLCTRRWLRPEWALPAALFALFGAGGAGELIPWRDAVGPLVASNLIDATATFFPATMAACFLIVFIVSRSTPTIIAASIFASHAMCTHVVAVSLLPALVASAALAGRNPVRSAVLALAIVGVTSVGSSAYAVSAVADHFGLMEVIEILFGFAIIIVACQFVQPWFLRLKSIRRAALLGAMLLLPIGCGALWLYLDHRPPTSRYLAPLIAPLAVMLAAIISIVVGRIPVVGRWLPIIIAAGCVIAARAPADRAQWEFEDGRLVAKALEAHGWCYEREFARLQGPRCRSLADATMPYACRASQPAAGMQQWRAAFWDGSSPSELPRDAEVLKSEAGRVVVISPIISWLDKLAAEACVEYNGTRNCRRAESPDSDPFLYSHRLWLGFPEANMHPPFKMSFSFPVKPVAGQAHLFSFGEIPFPLPAQAHCGWQVTRADGLDADRPLPANPVRLTSPDGKPGTLTIELAVGDPECHDGFPGWEIPCHWETSADDPAWMNQSSEVH